MKTAIYAGSFDPVTLGHLDIIKRAGEQYDRVIIVVAHNPAKKGMFDVQHRVNLIWEALQPDARTMEYHLALEEEPHLRPVPYVPAKYIVTTLPRMQLLVEYAHKIGAKALVRGLRAMSDFEAEFQMALANRKLAPDIETVFFMTAHEYLFTSSSLVREVASLGGDLSAFVPPNVIQALKKKFPR